MIYSRQKKLGVKKNKKFGPTGNLLPDVIDVTKQRLASQKGTD